MTWRSNLERTAYRSERSSPRQAITIIITSHPHINNFSRLWQFRLVCAKVRCTAKTALATLNVRTNARHCLCLVYHSGCIRRACQRAERGVAAEVGVEAEGCAAPVGWVGKVGRAVCAGGGKTITHSVVHALGRSPLCGGCGGHVACGKRRGIHTIIICRSRPHIIYYGDVLQGEAVGGAVDDGFGRVVVGVVVHHAVLHGERGVARVDGRARVGGVVLEYAVAHGHLRAGIGYHSRAVVERGRACGISVDDVEAVERDIGSGLHGHHMIDAVFNARAPVVAVELRAVCEPVALHGIRGISRAVVASTYGQWLVARHGHYVHGGRLGVVVHKGIARPEVALKDADFEGRDVGVTYRYITRGNAR